MLRSRIPVTTYVLREKVFPLWSAIVNLVTSQPIRLGFYSDRF